VVDVGVPGGHGTGAILRRRRLSACRSRMAVRRRSVAAGPSTVDGWTGRHWSDPSAAAP